MKALMNFFYDHDAEVVLIACVCLSVALLSGLVYVGVEEAKDWNEFSKEYECKLIEKGTSDVVPVSTVTPKGNIAFSTAVVSTPDRYLCNDGVVYQR